MSRKTGNFIAPKINYGVNLPCDKMLSGTTTLSAGLLQKTVLSVTDWWRSQGFCRFVLLTFHGDPFHIEVLSELGRDIYLLELYEIEYSDILEKQASMRHACEAETSIALHLYPEKVRVSQIRESDIPYSVFEDYLFQRVQSEPEGYVGSLGFPSAATAEKSKVIVTRMIEKMLEDYYTLRFDVLILNIEFISFSYQYKNQMLYN